MVADLACVLRLCFIIGVAGGTKLASTIPNPAVFVGSDSVIEYLGDLFA